MASAVMHLAIAKRINEKLKLNEKELFLGTIAPDTSAIVGMDKTITHFKTPKDERLPDIDYFYSKYKNYLNNPYDIGYYIHLLTDELWLKEFLPNFVLSNDTIRDKNGEIIKLDEKSVSEIMYNDYSNLNRQIIDYYNLDLSLFYDKFVYPNPNIKEVPSEYFDILLEKMRFISEKTYEYQYIFNIEKIVIFINYTSEYILERLKQENILK